MNLDNYFRLKRKDNDFNMIKSVKRINPNLADDNDDPNNKKSFKDMFQEMIDEENAND